MPWGWLIAWATAWLLHDRLAAAEPAQRDETRLGVLMGGAVVAIGTPLDAAYERWFGATADEMASQQ